jgi:hypothetical protein
LLENGFGNLDLWAVESFGKVMEILAAEGVRTLIRLKMNTMLVPKLIYALGSAYHPSKLIITEHYLGDLT